MHSELHHLLARCPNSWVLKVDSILEVTTQFQQKTMYTISDNLLLFCLFFLQQLKNSTLRFLFTELYENLTVKEWIAVHSIQKQTYKRKLFRLCTDQTLTQWFLVLINSDIKVFHIYWHHNHFISSTNIYWAWILILSYHPKSKSFNQSTVNISNMDTEL